TALRVRACGAMKSSLRLTDSASCLSCQSRHPWLDPAGLFQAEFHRFRRRLGVILIRWLLFQAFQKTT
ncbi:MAG: hypothetical protein ACI9W6_003020, partial [Motiliproteus sp.]